MEGSNPVNSYCFRSKFSQKDENIIDHEIEKLLEMNAIIEVQHDRNEYISPIFTVPKKDGEYRMILNLKNLNQHIKYHHFKMETFEAALKLVKENCFFASVDLRHAYYSVPIAEDQQITLRFQKSGKNLPVCMFTKWYFLCAPTVYKTHETSLCIFAHAWTHKFWLY